jgi:hypothetical protein
LSLKNIWGRRFGGVGVGARSQFLERVCQRFPAQPTPRLATNLEHGEDALSKNYAAKKNDRLISEVDVQSRVAATHRPIRESRGMLSPCVAADQPYVYLS